MALAHQAQAALRVLAPAASADALVLSIAELPAPTPGPGQALVRVAAAGVNPSDVKAAMGLMPQAVWPRTPGRDFAGTVVAGAPAWVGREVWGSGGDLGITRDGSHGAWLLLPEAALREKPQRISFDEAGSVGVPFVTAVEGFRRAQGVHAGQVVAVMGANGKVGQAAVQLAAQAGATVIAVHRQDGPHKGFACSAVHTVDARHEDVAARIRDISRATRGGPGAGGADIVFNTVGSPYFDAANRALAKGGTQIFIATLDRAVPFDIFSFYRGMHTYVGIDTLALDCVASCERIASLHAGMQAGTLQPFAVNTRGVSTLPQALLAYQRVLGGADERIVLRP